jgi:hypothetical protein
MAGQLMIEVSVENLTETVSIVVLGDAPSF